MDAQIFWPPGQAFGLVKLFEERLLQFGFKVYVLVLWDEDLAKMEETSMTSQHNKSERRFVFMGSPNGHPPYVPSLVFRGKPFYMHGQTKMEPYCNLTTIYICSHSASTGSAAIVRQISRAVLQPLLAPDLNPEEPILSFLV